MRNPTIRWGIAVTLGAGLAAGWTGSAGIAEAQSADVLLAGTITDAAGEPLEGVVVSVRASGSNLTTSVYTDADGDYVFPGMAPGPYRLWAQAVSYAAGRAELELRSATHHRDFVMESLESFEAQLPGDRWVAALPEDTPEDRRMKTVFRVSCGGCHSQNTALLTRFDEQGWLNIITVMSRIATSGWVASPMAAGPAREDRPPSPLMDYYKERLAAYLAKVRGPGPSPMNFVPRPRPTGDAVLAVIREYDTPGQGYGLPMWEDGTDWTEGAPSKTSRKNHHAMDGTLDFDGNLYFSDDLNTNPYRSVGKVDAETGLVTNVHVPRRRMPEMASAVHDLIADQKGTLWFGADGRLIALDPETLEWEAVTTPDGELVRAGGFHDKDGLRRRLGRRPWRRHPLRPEHTHRDRVPKPHPERQARLGRHLRHGGGSRRQRLALAVRLRRHGQARARDRRVVQRPVTAVAVRARGGSLRRRRPADLRHDGGQPVPRARPSLDGTPSASRAAGSRATRPGGRAGRATTW